MPNPFDQFDAQANAFDQFDSVKRKKKGFIDRSAGHIDDYSRELAETQALAESGEINPVQHLIRDLGGAHGTGMDITGDVVGTGAGALARALTTPEQRQSMGEGWQDFAESAYPYLSPVGEAVETGAGHVGEFLENNPTLKGLGQTLMGATGLGAGIKAAPAVIGTTKAAAKVATPAARELARAGTRGAGRLKQTLTPSGNKPEAKAMAQVVDRLKKDYPDTWQDELVAWKEGKAPLIEQAGSQLEGKAKGAAQYPSGEKPALEYFMGRTEDVPAKVGKTAQQNISPSQAYYADADSLLKGGRNKARPFYDRAYAQKGVGADEQLQAFINTPEVQKGIKEGIRLDILANKGKKGFDPSDYGITRFDEAGDPIIEGVPSMRALDMGKRGLDAQIQRADRAGDYSTANALKSLRTSYRDRLKELNPAYKEALDVSGDYLEVQNAIKSGKDFYKMDVELVERNLKKMTAPEREAYKIGAVKALRDKVGRMAFGRNPTTLLTPDTKRKFKALLAPKELKKFEADLKAEDRMFHMRNKVLGGSPTAGKAVEAMQIGGEGLENAMQLAIDVSSGGKTAVGRAALRAVGNVFKKSTRGLNDDIAEQVAKILYETNPEKKALMLERALNNKALKGKARQDLGKAFFELDDAVKAKAGGAAKEPWDTFIKRHDLGVYKNKPKELEAGLRLIKNKTPAQMEQEAAVKIYMREKGIEPYPSKPKGE